MARFMYQARDGRGALGSGTIAATNADEAGQLLRADGKFVINLTEVEEDDGDTMTLAQHAKRCKRTDVIYFAHQMAIMVDSPGPMRGQSYCPVDQAVARSRVESDWIGQFFSHYRHVGDAAQVLKCPQGSLTVKMLEEKRSQRSALAACSDVP